jgi:hypothetical protein
MKYIKTFELKSSTYLAASDLAHNYGQKTLANKFYTASQIANRREENNEKEPDNSYIENNPIMKILNKFTFKIKYYKLKCINDYEDFHFENIGDFTFIYDIVDVNEVWFHFALSEKDQQEYIKKGIITKYDEPYFTLSMYWLHREDMEVSLLEDHEAKFYNKKEVNKFFNILKKIYEFEDPKYMNNLYSKLHGKEIKNMQGGEFHKWVNEKYGNFEHFLKILNNKKRFLYDSF